jgi:hypothetical protein
VIYPTFLGDWVFDTFRCPMSVHLLASKDIEYDWLLEKGECPVNNAGKLSEKWLGEHMAVGPALAQADNMLARMIMVLQLAWEQMQDHDVQGEYNKKFKQIITAMTALQDKIVSTMGEDQIRAQRDPPLPDDFIPEEYANLEAGEDRNLRDWIFVRESKKVCEVIAQIFGHFVTSNA